MGTLLTVSAFNHERAPTSCLERLEALEANSECCVPSGLDFEAAGDSVVHYFVSNYTVRCDGEYTVARS